MEQKQNKKTFLSQADKKNMCSAISTQIGKLIIHLLIYENSYRYIFF